MPGAVGVPSQRGVLVSVEDKKFIALVEDDHQVPVQGQVHDPVHLIGRNDGSGRIVGRVDHHGPGARGHLGFQGRCLEDKVILLPGHDLDRHGSNHLELLRKSHPVGNGKQHLVPFFEQGEGQVEQRVLGAAGDHHLGHGVVDSILAAVLFHHGFPEVFDARRRGVAGEVVVDGPVSYTLDVVGRVEVRLTDAEVHHLSTFGAQAIGLFRHRHGRRGRKAPDPFG